MSRRRMPHILVELRGRLGPPSIARRRFLRELADHVEDSMRAELAAGAAPGEGEARVLERFGSVEEIALAWRERRRSSARARRRRVALLAATAGASVLAVSAQANSHRPKPSAPPCASTSTSGGGAPPVSRCHYR
jgi:hypothetical protein